MNTLSELAGDQQSGDKSRTFIFNDENHTLGNCLVSIITQYEDVLFCGYTVPHPAEQKMHLRIQTNGPPAIQILQRGLQDLEKKCDQVAANFKTARREYMSKEMEDVD
ncbi:probable DNA-directed RNA polymerases I and III subunit RPAC2 [Macrosteles quadrilineatus]|uniref:probable DNA-directed RNA polymerases I and III subunit RPAC2 n=1 Tax=Macrosteles quadrilineatus TaxID=74068 RepID=UPI0023E132A4|nr:probable DNA-directed RNA polymerases I and III subunit RPAC2 [Macrosteles quadrilineatus]XP_054268303.1 probable DNA-directed RNA polymerases I and III subunit RPAC2 [Macrosteles quadrilineatus]